MHAELFDMNQLVCRGFIANPVQAETATLQPCWQIPNAWEGHAAMGYVRAHSDPSEQQPPEMEQVNALQSDRVFGPNTGAWLAD